MAQPRSCAATGAALIGLLRIIASATAVSGCRNTSDPRPPTPFVPPPATLPGSLFAVELPDDGFRVFRLWCAEGAPCAVSDLAPLNASTTDDLLDPHLDDPAFFATPPPQTGMNLWSDWGLVQARPLPTLYANAGPTRRRFVLRLRIRQNAGNSVENDRNRLPILAIRVSLTRETALLAAVRDLHAQALPPIDAVRLRRAGESAWATRFDFESHSQGWVELSSEFELEDTCSACRLVLTISQDSWTSYWGNQFFLGNVTVEQVPSAILLPPAVHVRDHEVVRLPVMPRASDRTAEYDLESCPHRSAHPVLLWEDPATWPDHTVPTVGSNVTLPDNATVLLRSCALPWVDPVDPGEASLQSSESPALLPTPAYASVLFDTITVPASSALVFDDDGPITLAMRSLVVYGTVSAGNASCRRNHSLTLVLHGTKNDTVARTPSQGLFASKGVLVLGGSIDLHGKEFYPWTRLGRTAFPGDSYLYVQEAVDWEPGQQVVVTPTIWRTLDVVQDEVRRVVHVDATGHIVRLDAPLRFVHYAGREYQAEVALLSRRIEIHGGRSDPSEGGGPDPAFSAAAFGGHVMVMDGGVGRFSGVAAVRMGQRNELGRYPFHFHLNGASPQSFVSDCAIVESFYRGVVVHGTHEVTVTRNVAFDVQGHCFYLEDGVEERNTFSFNLAARIHPIGRPAAGFGQFGEVFLESDDLRNPADASAGGFYITNAWNTFVGNVAVGGWTGFAFPALPRPINLHRHLDFSDSNRNPWHRSTLVFDGNTARSTASHWYESGGVYVGGLIRHLDDQPGSPLVYASGRLARETFSEDGSQYAWMNFTNTLAALTWRGIAHWGSRVEVHAFENHDSMRSLVLFGEALVRNALVTGRTENSELVDLHMGGREGFQFYDTWVKSMLSNVTFRRFDPALGDRVILGMTHSDTFKPQGINAVRNIRFEECPRPGHLRIDDASTGAAWMYNILDADGSLSQRGVPTIVGSHRPWWNYDPARCAQDADWSLWLCDLGDRAVASVELTMPGITRTPAEENTFESHRHIGYMSLLRDPAGTRLPLTKNPTSTGVADEPWLLELFGGSPTDLYLDALQVPLNHILLLAIPYAPNTTFSVRVTQRYFGGPIEFVVPEAASLDEVLDPHEVPGDRAAFQCPSLVSLCDTQATGPRWFFNGSLLFLRVVDLANYASQYRNFRDFQFQRDGLTLNSIELGFLWHVQASCPDTLCDRNRTCAFPGAERLPNRTEYNIPEVDYTCPWRFGPPGDDGGGGNGGGDGDEDGDGDEGEGSFQCIVVGPDDGAPVVAGDDFLVTWKLTANESLFVHNATAQLWLFVWGPDSVSRRVRLASDIDALASSELVVSVDAAVVFDDDDDVDNDNGSSESRSLANLLFATLSIELTVSATRQSADTESSVILRRLQNATETWRLVRPFRLASASLDAALRDAFDSLEPESDPSTINATALYLGSVGVGTAGELLQLVVANTQSSEDGSSARLPLRGGVPLRIGWRHRGISNDTRLSVTLAPLDSFGEPQWDAAHTLAESLAAAPAPAPTQRRERRLREGVYAVRIALPNPATPMAAVLSLASTAANGLFSEIGVDLQPAPSSSPSATPSPPTASPTPSASPTTAAAASPTPTATGISSPSSSPSAIVVALEDWGSQGSSGDGTVAIAVGVSVGAAVALGLIGAGVWAWRSRQRQRESAQSKLGGKNAALSSPRAVEASTPLDMNRVLMTVRSPNSRSDRSP